MPPPPPPPRGRGPPKPATTASLTLKKKAKDGLARQNGDGKRERVRLNPLVVGIQHSAFGTPSDSRVRLCSGQPGAAATYGSTHHELYDDIAMRQFIVGVDDRGHHRHSKVEIAGQHLRHGRKGPLQENLGSCGQLGCSESKTVKGWGCVVF